MLTLLNENCLDVLGDLKDVSLVICDPPDNLGLKYDQYGDLVVDPFVGTGTTLRVCNRINRDCVGIEIDPSYCSEIKKDKEFENVE